METVSLKGVIDMHVHSNPDIRHRAYDDFELTEVVCQHGWFRLHSASSVPL